MAWMTPKTNWGTADGVRDTDMNRIEGNILDLYNTTLVRNNITLYVATTGNDNTGTGTSAAPYATINKALSTLPKNLSGKTVSINIAAGTYNEDVVVSNFSNGIVILTGSVYTVTINNLSVDNCVCRINTINLTTKKISITNGATLLAFVTLTSTADGLFIDNCARAHILEFAMSASSTYGIYINNNASAYISNINIGVSITNAIYAVGGGVLAYGSAYNLTTSRITTGSGGRVYTGSASGGVGGGTMSTAEVIE